MVSIQVRLGLAAAVLAAGSFALGFLACGDGESGPRESDVIAGITTLDSAGLQAIDESINAGQQAPANARTVMLHLAAVTKLTDWPSDLDDEAGALAQTFTELAAALNTDTPDLARAGELATKAHDDELELSREVWAWLQEKAGVGEG